MSVSHWGEWERWVQMFLLQYPEEAHSGMVRWLEPPGGGNEEPWFSPEGAQQFWRWLMRKPGEELREAQIIIPITVMPIRDGWQVAVSWNTAENPPCVDLRLQYWDVDARLWQRTEHGFRLTVAQWAEFRNMLTFVEAQLQAHGVGDPPTPPPGETPA